MRLTFFRVRWPLLRFGCHPVARTRYLRGRAAALLDRLGVPLLTRTGSRLAPRNSPMPPLLLARTGEALLLRA